MNKKIFIICPVRKVPDWVKELLRDYVDTKRAEGYNVHYPPDNTNQEDPSGRYRICSNNCQAIVDSNEVHVYWNGSEGSYFDFGISFNEHRRNSKLIKLINRSDVEIIVERQKKDRKNKSFEQVLLKLDDLASD